MKPKNRLQKQVVELSAQLPTITSTQQAWAFRKCFKHYALMKTDGTSTCTACGDSWKSEHTLANTLCGCTCPHCGMNLETLHTRKRKFRQTEYFGIVTTFKGWQVLRYFYMQSYQKKGEPAHYFVTEVVQRWITPQGKSVVLARLRPMNYWYDTWQFGTDLEVRTDKEAYDIVPTAIYPRQRVLPEIKRNGFKGEYHRLTPYELFHAILTDNKAETLLKTGQFAVLRHFVRAKYKSIANYWPSIRICIRNGYIITDGAMWCDYVDGLRRQQKDVHSPKYLCPTNLAAEHDRVMAEICTRREREEKLRKRRKAVEDELRFQALKSKFFGLCFTDGKIHVHVLESVQEHLEEGAAMHHCVFDSAYYLKEHSLILSATIAGKRIETIEVSLQTLKVVQSRGICNQTTEYHDQIVNLVNANKSLIQQRMKATA